MLNEHPEYEYAGFWYRTGACIVDSIIFSLVSLPVLLMFYGADYFDRTAFFRGPADVVINLVLPVLLTVVLWRWFQATPGKMALRLRVVDAQSGQAASTGQYIIRYVGYVLSTLPVGLGFLWIAFDNRKQGWHDKLARTVVVRELRKTPVRFRGDVEEPCGDRGRPLPDGKTSSAQNRTEQHGLKG
ncbi:RDD family protein [Salmonella enterica subsp. diarizonae]|uniref:RDD family protein n=1 Tax=Salmonella diarizonae TaxID=59204 RepID=A0A6C8Y098_SALDZ|nr:RDD family protein [Salmonella enterica subsp. diarizonae]